MADTGRRVFHDAGIVVLAVRRRMFQVFGGTTSLALCNQDPRKGSSIGSHRRRHVLATNGSLVASALEHTFLRSRKNLRNLIAALASLK